MTIIDTPEGIAFARLCALRGRLRLEIQGLTSKGRGIMKILHAHGDVPATVRTKKAALAYIEERIEECRRARREAVAAASTTV